MYYFNEISVEVKIWYNDKLNNVLKNYVIVEGNNWEFCLQDKD